MRSISDILYKSSHFKVSITLFCNDDNKTESNLKYKRNNLITVSKNKNTNEINSIYLDSYARAVKSVPAFSKYHLFATTPLNTVVLR